MPVAIQSVTPRSPADKAGITAGETLEKINSEPVIDEIDYQALTASSRLTLTVTDSRGDSREVFVYGQKEVPVFQP